MSKKKNKQMKKEEQTKAEVCQLCKFHRNKPSYCTTKEVHVNRKGTICPSFTIK